MKHIIYTLIIVIGFFNIQKNKEYNKVIYKRSIHLEDLPNSIINRYSKEQIKAIKLKYSKYSELEYSLIFNDKEGYFSLENSKVALDSDIGNNNLNKIIKIEKNKACYYNLNEKRIILERVRGGEKLLVTDSLNKVKWNLTNETKKIGEYLCYKATIKEGKQLLAYDDNLNIEAWYTPQIPISLGPVQFEGLPGLILELRLGRNIYYASSVKFNQIDSITIPTKGRLISRQKYSKQLNEFAKSLKVRARSN